MRTTIRPKGRILAKSREQRDKRLVPEVRISDMSDVDWKIHKLLIAEGYEIANTRKMTGDKGKIIQIEYEIEYEQKEKKTVISYMIMSVKK